MSIRKVMEEMERMRRSLETPETLRFLSATDEAMKRFATLYNPTSLTAQIGQMQTITDSIKLLKTDPIPRSMLDMIDVVKNMDSSRIAREHFERPRPVPDFTFPTPMVRRQRRLPERTIVRKEVTRRIGFGDFEK